MWTSDLVLQKLSQPTEMVKNIQQRCWPPANGHTPSCCQLTKLCQDWVICTISYKLSSQVHTPSLVRELNSCVDLTHTNDHCRDHRQVQLWDLEFQSESTKLAISSPLHAQHRVAAGMPVTAPYLGNKSTGFQVGCKAAEGAVTHQERLKMNTFWDVLVYGKPA